MSKPPWFSDVGQTQWFSYRTTPRQTNAGAAAGAVRLAAAVASPTVCHGKSTCFHGEIIHEKGPPLHSYV